MKFNPDARATLIGSLPVSDHSEAIDLVLKYTSDIPIWVQLPVYKNERLLSQFVAGLPGIKFRDDTVYFDTSDPDFESQLLSFFEEYLEVTEAGKEIADTRFALDEDHAPGFFLLLKAIEDRNLKPFAIKGQITGTFTLLTGIKDQNQKLAYYDIQLREIVVKAVALKARFQIEQMKRVCSQAICFLDEPALAGFGSSGFVGISKEDVCQDMAEAVNCIHDAGGIAGVHVCANTDWSVILDSDVDILSFDAFSYFDRFKLFKDKIHAFLNRGGTIAWGLVPTLNQKDLEAATLNDLFDMWCDQVEELDLSKEFVASRCLVTPSCGTGLLSRDLSVKALDLTAGLSEAIRDKFC